ncbi:MAG: menaquinone biosynthesis protein [Fimbriimonadales bacterium]|nr:menaquinone biosynthesis protein [Fimbriimonadales bacterium]
MRFRVGSVPYINAAPLTRWLETDAGARYAEVVYAPPSELARQLAQGALDVALVSSVEHFRRPETRFVPGLAIASRREVLSVRLFCKAPVAQLRTVALDTSSLTSAALTRILLERAYGVHAQYVSAAPDLDSMLRCADAALLIGDLGMTAAHEAVVQVVDLGAAWHDWTGLPFVWAVWQMHANAPFAALTELLHTAYQWGKAHLEMLVDAEAARAGIPHALCRRYLHEVMVYEIDASFLQGLARFRQEYLQGLSGRTLSTAEAVRKLSLGRDG